MLGHLNKSLVVGGSGGIGNAKIASSYRSPGGPREVTFI